MEDCWNKEDENKMKDIVEIQFWQLVAAYLFVLIPIFIVKMKGINREYEIIFSSLRMTLQLIIMGYVLTFILKSSNPSIVLIIIAIMEIFSITNIYKRIKFDISKDLKGIIALAMIVGTLSCTCYFIVIVVPVSPWYEPRYLIPLSGMIIGNTMTGIALGVNRLVNDIINQKVFVEAALMLGATPKNATREIVKSSFDAAFLPTINSMVGMGIVFLPGMMTGQIIAGIEPVAAIKYQIAIMFGIVGSVALSVIICIQLGYKTFFNNQDQLVI